jgi:hypothetical protein
MNCARHPSTDNYRYDWNREHNKAVKWLRKSVQYLIPRIDLPELILEVNRWIKGKIADTAEGVYNYVSNETSDIYNDVGDAAKDFTMGAGYSVDNNMDFGIITHVAGMDEDELPDSTACEVGRVTGDVVSIIESQAEMTAGAAMEPIGGFIDLQVY